MGVSSRLKRGDGERLNVSASIDIANAEVKSASGGLTADEVHSLDFKMNIFV